MFCGITNGESYSLQHLALWEKVSKVRLLVGNTTVGIKLLDEQLESITFILLYFDSMVLSTILVTYFLNLYVYMYVHLSVQEHTYQGTHVVVRSQLVHELPGTLLFLPPQS